MGISDSKLNQDLIERYKLTTKSRAVTVYCDPSVKDPPQLCPHGVKCPADGVCPGGAPPPPPGPTPHPPPPPGSLGWCHENLQCAPGTQCCQIGADKKGCAPLATTEAQCVGGGWHPIGPTDPCKGKTRIQDCSNHGDPTKSPDGKSCLCVCDDGYSWMNCAIITAVTIVTNTRTTFSVWRFCGISVIATITSS